MKIVKVIACAIGFGVLGAGIGFPVALLGLETGVFGKQQGFSGFTYLIGSMWVFGILGAALGGSKTVICSDERCYCGWKKTEGLEH